MKLLLHILGVDDPSGRWYLWWSGSGADLSYLAVFGTLIRRHNCHVRGCWRLGKHPLPDSSWLVCRRHSGMDRLTAAAARATTGGTP